MVLLFILSLYDYSLEVEERIYYLDIRGYVGIRKNKEYKSILVLVLVLIFVFLRFD